VRQRVGGGSSKREDRQSESVRVTGRWGKVGRIKAKWEVVGQ